MDQSERDTGKGLQRWCDKVARQEEYMLPYMIPSLLHQYCIVHVVRVVASYLLFFCIMPKGCMFHRCARKNNINLDSGKHTHVLTTIPNLKHPIVLFEAMLVQPGSI